MAQEDDEVIDSGLSEEEQKINLAYQCLEDKIGTDCAELTQEEQAFSILALGDHEDCRNEFLENSDNEECWPSGNCKLVDTSIALLALDRIGEDTDKIEAWLLNQTKAASDLKWYIEIDADSETSCDINYDGLPHTLTINEDKTIASSAGTCLPISSNGFWLEISSICLEKEFKISCDKDFKSTLLYTTQLSSTIHVSQNLNSASANGETIEEVTFKCFEEGTVCNYEGGLWATTALNKKGYTTNEFMPYLDAFSSENKGFFPEVFLYILGDRDLLTSILQDNFNGQSWQVGSYSRLYNTALAFLAINGQGTTQEIVAKNNLLDNQENNGCFGNIKETGFLLYTGWPRDIGTGGNEDECSVDSDCLDGEECFYGDCREPSSSGSDCEAFGNYCESFSDCIDSGGNILDNFVGCSGGTICCSEEVIIPSCSNQNGHLCSDDEQCPLEHKILTSSDFGLCCAGFCEPFIVDPTEPTTNECEQAGGTCKSSCVSGEEEEFYSCGDVGGECCFEEKGSLLWVWILLGAIVVLIILILLRNKLKLFFFRIKNKFKKGGKPRPTRPGLFPPGRRPLPPRMRSHPSPSTRSTRPPAHPLARHPIKPTASKDKDFEDTLKKLKDMSK